MLSGQRHIHSLIGGQLSDISCLSDLVCRYSTRARHTALCGGLQEPCYVESLSARHFMLLMFVLAMATRSWAVTLGIVCVLVLVLQAGKWSFVFTAMNCSAVYNQYIRILVTVKRD